MVGVQALLLPVIFLIISTKVVLDVEAQRFYKSVKDKYFTELGVTEIEEEIKVDVTSKRAAVKFGLMAQAKVGVLSPTVANRLVYETVLLRIFEEQHVRHNIRLELLGEALLSCFVRPESYEIALRVIDSLNAPERHK
jgi:hypothetical protein